MKKKIGIYLFNCQICFSSMYPFRKNQRILGFFDNFENYLDEDAMWQISETIKPRLTRKAASLHHS